MYRRLARVLEDTARRQCAAWGVRVERIEPPEYVSAAGNQSYAWNTQKLEWWRARVMEAAPGTRLLLIDGDTAILRPLDPVWGIDFDIAYTVRPHGLPLNGGVLFLRVGTESRAFVERWWATNLRFLRDPAAHRPWHLKYAGMNQAAFGKVLETARDGCRLLALPCREWNACSPELYERGLTRVLHIKSRLRRATFGTEPPRPNMSILIKLWHSLERRATRKDR